MTKPETEDVTAVVKTKTEAVAANGNPFWKLQLQHEDGKLYSYSMFDHEAGRHLVPGQRCNFRVSAKPNPKGGVYRNIEGFLGYEPGKGDGGAAPPEPDAFDGDFQGYAIRDLSIQRQVALKAAVEYAGFRIKQGMELKPDDVLKAAASFAKWLRNGD